MWYLVAAMPAIVGLLLIFLRLEEVLRFSISIALECEAIIVNVYIFLLKFFA